MQQPELEHKGGLQNKPGWNQCFLNAVITLLAHSTPFVAAIRKYHGALLKPKAVKAVARFRNLIVRLTIAVVDKLDCGISRRALFLHKGYTQTPAVEIAKEGVMEDAGDLLGQIIRETQALLWFQTFSYRRSQYLCCVSCQGTNQYVEKFSVEHHVWHLAFPPLPENSRDCAVMTLESLWEDHLNSTFEVLDCKSEELASPPRHNESCIDANNARICNRFKVTSKPPTSIYMKLQRWCQQDVHGSQDKIIQRVSVPRTHAWFAGTEYSLKGLVLHRGQMLDTGHYVSIGFDQSGCRLYDDETVVTVSSVTGAFDERVGSQHGDVYLILYERTPVSPSNAIVSVSSHPDALTSAVAARRAEEQKYACFLGAAVSSTFQAVINAGAIKARESIGTWRCVQSNGQVSFLCGVCLARVLWGKKDKERTCSKFASAQEAESHLRRCVHQHARYTCEKCQQKHRVANATKHAKQCSG